MLKPMALLILKSTGKLGNLEKKWILELWLSETFFGNAPESEKKILLVCEFLKQIVTKI